MTLHTIGLAARVAALFTFKWLFSSVCDLVLLEITSLSARIVTLLTPERDPGISRDPAGAWSLVVPIPTLPPTSQVPVVYTPISWQEQVSYSGESFQALSCLSVISYHLGTKTNTIC